MWGTDAERLQGISQETGIPMAKALVALGSTWQLDSKKTPTFGKETQRIDVCKERLRRVSFLPAHPAIRAAVAASTCLSLLDFLAPPTKKPFHNLRQSVMKVGSLLHGAPEMVFNIPTSGLLDPLERSMLSLLRLWAGVAIHPTCAQVLSPPNLHKSKGRLGLILRECRQRGWELTPTKLVIRAENYSKGFLFRNSWKAMRAEVICAIKDLALRKLQARRPDKFDGAIACHWTHMWNFYAALPSYEATTMMRIWSGAIMTK